VRALAEQAERVLVITMFPALVAGWADLVLPATGSYEREGTAINLEGRVQRLRRSVPAPCPDELTWLSALGSRFGVEIPPYAAVLFDELAGLAFPGLALDDLGLRAPLAARAPYVEPAAGTTPAPPPLQATGDERFVGLLRLQRYRPLFSGPDVERVPELHFQRPAEEVELSAADAERRGISTGDLVAVRSNGTSVELTARVNRRLLEGVARVADVHARDLHANVEIVRA
jgi:predicted molibdopterin-dependent oxidoreductase YjgC